MGMDTMIMEMVMDTVTMVMTMTTMMMVTMVTVMIMDMTMMITAIEMEITEMDTGITAIMAGNQEIFTKKISENQSLYGVMAAIEHNFATMCSLSKLHVPREIRRLHVASLYALI